MVLERNGATLPGAPSRAGGEGPGGKLHHTGRRCLPSLCCGQRAKQSWLHLHQAPEAHGPCTLTLAPGPCSTRPAAPPAERPGPAWAGSTAPAWSSGPARPAGGPTGQAGAVNGVSSVMWQAAQAGGRAVHACMLMRTPSWTAPRRHVVQQATARRAGQHAAAPGPPGRLPQAPSSHPERSRVGHSPPPLLACRSPILPALIRSQKASGVCGAAKPRAPRHDAGKQRYSKTHA